ncbi:MAG TPA: VanZ family protein [Acidobacteriota bacterium]|nr:VanZ family protein [Acidobacteriota bacterium]
MSLWIRRWGMAILMMAAIFIASGTPGNDLPQLGHWDLFAKKGGHMLGYGLLAIGYLRGLANGKPITWRQCALAVIFSILYAATDEFHQSFVAGRNSSIDDVMIDAVGAGFGTGMWTWIRHLVMT